MTNTRNGSVFCLNEVEPALHEEAVVVLCLLLLFFIRVQYCSPKLCLSDVQLKELCSLVSICPNCKIRMVLSMKPKESATVKVE